MTQTYLHLSIDLLPNFADRVKARKELIALLQERDDLIAALEGILKGGGGNHYEVARNVLRKARGEPS